MPATSERQKHMMQMALAKKRGHRIEGVSEATQTRLSEMASSMSEETLEEFATRKPRKKSVLTHGTRR